LALFRPLLLIATLAAGCATAPVSAPPDTPSAPEAQGAVATGRAVDRTQRDCMAQAMYWEARGEGHHGMLAVGSVVLNRVDDPRFPGTVCGVVHDGGETPPCQFSWWCDGKSDRPTNQSLWAQSQNVAEQMLTARPTDPTGGALFFHNTSIRKPWQRVRTAQIGAHVFYR
jgi:spore germination cell wall hydrolase CwlJ-like protein